MPKYMILYKGEATDLSDMSEEEAGAVMAKWTTWIEKLGPGLTDVGTPFGPGSSVVDNGSVGTAISFTGYSIVEAADMEGAQALTDGHPYLSEGKGDYAIDVFELLPVPFDS
ncbi:MAG: YciI family protein [Acidimicrobiia bacterium]